MRNMAKLYANYAGKRDQEQRHFEGGGGAASHSSWQSNFLNKLLA